MSGSGWSFAILSTLVAGALLDAQDLNLQNVRQPDARQDAQRQGPNEGFGIGQPPLERVDRQQLQFARRRVGWSFTKCVEPTEVLLLPRHNFMAPLHNFVVYILY
jgi:hypothetical protein